MLQGVLRKETVEFTYNKAVTSPRTPKEKKSRVMKNISVANARWIGSLLAELSDEQLRAAFRAANYDQQTMNGFVAVIRDRINQLNKLDAAAVASR